MEKRSQCILISDAIRVTAANAFRMLCMVECSTTCVRTHFYRRRLSEKNEIYFESMTALNVCRHVPSHRRQHSFNKFTFNLDQSVADDSAWQNTICAFSAIRLWFFCVCLFRSHQWPEPDCGTTFLCATRIITYLLFINECKERMKFHI